MDESEKKHSLKKSHSKIRKARSDLIIHAFGELRRYLPYLFDEPHWALIKFLDLESWHVFEVGAYSRLGAY